MFGRRCTLCGGKLDSHNICTECGLDNNKSEKNYRINQSSCDDLPLTHVHTETYQKPRREEPRRTAQKSSTEKQRQTTSQGTFGQPRPQQQMYTGQKKRSGCMTCVVVLIVAVVILVLVGLLAGFALMLPGVLLFKLIPQVWNGCGWLAVAAALYLTAGILLWRFLLTRGAAMLEEL